MIEHVFEPTGQLTVVLWTSSYAEGCSRQPLYSLQSSWCLVVVAVVGESPRHCIDAASTLLRQLRLSIAVDGLQIAVGDEPLGNKAAALCACGLLPLPPECLLPALDGEESRKHFFLPSPWLSAAAKHYLHHHHHWWDASRLSAASMMLMNDTGSALLMMIAAQSHPAWLPRLAWLLRLIRAPRLV